MAMRSREIRLESGNDVFRVIGIYLQEGGLHTEAFLDASVVPGSGKGASCRNQHTPSMNDKPVLTKELDCKGQTTVFLIKNSLREALLIITVKNRNTYLDDYGACIHALVHQVHGAP